MNFSILKVCFFLCILFGGMNNTYAQVIDTVTRNIIYAKNISKADTISTQAIIYEGDTISLRTLDYVYLQAKLTAAQRTANAKYNRLRNAVYVTYPFARRAGIVMNDINAKLVGVTDKAQRKTYIKSREKELKKEFTTPLKDLSIYQGKVLMKLINRETGSNCYEIIKEFKGGVTARFYQTVIFFFDGNLKQSYDADTDDAEIEKFVKEVQRMYGYDEAAHARVS
jgi:Domain of unknown function (DUF4294)